MSVSKKYIRTNFDDDDNGSMSGAGGGGAGDGTPPGVIYDPVIAFHAQGGTFCQRRTPLEKIALVIIFLLLCVVVGLVVLLCTRGGVGYNGTTLPSSMSQSGRGQKKAGPEELCLSKACVSASASILNSLDQSVHPCEDFYQYACGGWVASNPIPTGEPYWDTFDILRQKNLQLLKSLFEDDGDDVDAKEPSGGQVNTAVHSEAEKKVKIFYSSCMDANGTIESLGAQPLIDLIRQLGGWTVSSSSGRFNSAKWTLEGTLSKVQTLGLENFFYLTVADDEKVPTQHILIFDEGGLSLPIDHYINKTISDDEVLSAYLTYMTEVGVLLGGSNETTRRLMTDVIEFEQKIAAIMTPIEDRRDNEELYNKMPLKDLQAIAPFIMMSPSTVSSGFVDIETLPGLPGNDIVVESKTMNWRKFLNGVLSELTTSYKVNDTEQIVLRGPEFMAHLSQLVGGMMKTVEGNATLNNYMMWHVAMAVCESLSKEFRDAKTKFHNILDGVIGEKERWKRCVAEAENVLDFAVGAIFVRKMFKDTAEKSKFAAEEMIDLVKAAFTGNFPKLAWMDDETRLAAIEKAEAVVNMIGFPEYIRNSTQLDERFRELSISGSEYFKNNINTLRYDTRRNLVKLRKPTDRTSWEMSPTDLNAIYLPTMNQMIYPAALLQSPFFDIDFPRSLNFGAVGVVMGHELTHGFDDRGREYDKNGVLRSWWNEAVIARFKERAQCMIDQYSKYSAYGIHLRGKQTIGENIADNGGLKSAFYAYRQWLAENRGGVPEPLLPGLNFTHDQLFFVSFAQVWCTSTRQEDFEKSIMEDSHAPNRFRVLGTLSNSREFSEQFHCAPGSTMNPSDKCEVW